MATKHTVTGNIGDYADGWVSDAHAVLSVPAVTAVFDKGTNTIRRSAVPLDIAPDGSFAVDLLPTNSPDLPDGLQWTIAFRAVDPTLSQMFGRSVRQVVRLGPFDVTRDATLAELLGGTAPEDPQEPGEPTYRMGWELTAENTGLAGVGVTEAMLTAETVPTYGGMPQTPLTTGTHTRKRFTLGGNALAPGAGATFVECLIEGNADLVMAMGDCEFIDCDFRLSDTASPLTENVHGFGHPTYAGATAHVQFTRCKFTGGHMFVNVTMVQATLTNCYGYNQSPEVGGGQHRDGFTCRGAAESLPVRVLGCRWDSDQDSTTGAFFLQNTYGDGIVGVECRDSLLEGTGFNMVLSDATKLTISNNRLRGKAGAGVPGSAVFADRVQVAGTVTCLEWADNYVYDPDAPDGKGATIPLPAGATMVDPDEDPDEEEPPPDDPEPAVTHHVFGDVFPGTLGPGTDGPIKVANAFHLTTGTATCTGARLQLPAADALGAPITLCAWTSPTLGADPIASATITDPVEGWNPVTWPTPIAMTALTPLWIGYQGSDNRYLAYNPGVPDELVSATLPALRLSAAEGVGWTRSIWRYDSGSEGNGGNTFWGIDITVSA